MSEGSGLPRPRLTLRVGITGHRLNKLAPVHRDAVRTGLSGVLSTIDEAVLRLASRPGCALFDDARPEIRLVSALAEGADRFAIEAAPPAWTLAAILPMAREVYEADFIHPDGSCEDTRADFRAFLERASSVTELADLGPADAAGSEARNRRYAELGAFLVRHADIVVAVWDGERPEGPGGTANVVTAALARNLGVIWIHPDRPGEPRLLSGFDEADFAKPASQELTPGALDLLLDHVAAFAPAPASARQSGGHGGAHAAGRQHHTVSPPGSPAYLKEPWPRPLRLPVAFQALRWASGAGGWSWPLTYDSRDKLLSGWDDYFAEVEGQPAPAVQEDDLRRVLLPRSVWADVLAWVYSHRYRSAYVTVFGLAGLAVPIGLTYLFWQDSPAVLGIKAAFTMVELAIIVAIIALVRRGTRRQWHRTWIETRELSEFLRLSRPLASIGWLSDLVDAARSADGEAEPFSLWYARATTREIRPPPGRLDPARLRRVLAATLRDDIDGQIAYHRRNALNLERIHHALHRAGSLCFAATLVVLASYLLLWLTDQGIAPGHAAEAIGHGPPAAGHEVAAAGHDAEGSGLHHLLHEWIKPLVSILAAGLPAFGAAFAGIEAQGGFEERAERSHTTVRELLGIRREIEALLDAPEETATLARAGAILLEATRVMMEDVRSWRQAYSGKTLALPA